MKAVSAKAISLGQAAAPAAGAPTALLRGPGATGRVCPKPHAARLTPRQLEVLALLCEGLPNKLIARRLDIATGTVKIHVSCILRELGVATRMQAMLAAGRYGLAGGHEAAEQEHSGAAAARQPEMSTRHSGDRASRQVGQVALAA